MLGLGGEGGFALKTRAVISFGVYELGKEGVGCFDRDEVRFIDENGNDEKRDS